MTELSLRVEFDLFTTIETLSEQQQGYVIPVTNSALTANYTDCHGSRITSKKPLELCTRGLNHEFLLIKEILHNLHSKYQENITYSMLGIQLFQ